MPWPLVILGLRLAAANALRRDIALRVAALSDIGRIIDEFDEFNADAREAMASMSTGEPPAAEQPLGERVVAEMRARQAEREQLLFRKIEEESPGPATD